tara:strand:+ start:31 stop:234 length:204 start_codon:yes stop_codon:yes gene_type:complete
VSPAFKISIGEIKMDKNQGSKAPKGHGPGTSNHGASGQVGNQCPSGAGKGNIGTVKGDPLSVKIRTK